MKSKLSYIFIPYPQEIRLIQELLQELMSKADEELIDRYNRNVEMGIVGARAQIRHIIALGMIFKSRFGFNPNKITDNTLIELVDKVKLSNGKLIYENNIPNI